MLHMFHIYVASVCSKCFICFRLMLHSSISCCKCFVFQRYVQRVMGAQPGRSGKGRGELGVGRWGARHACGPADGACSSSSRLPGPARAERGGGQGEGVVGTVRVRVRGKARQTGDGRAHASAIRRSGRREWAGWAAACAGRPDALICSGRPGASTSHKMERTHFLFDRPLSWPVPILFLGKKYENNPSQC
jgi:hypothetical protein